VFILGTKPTITTHPNSKTVTITSDSECLSLTCEAKGASSYYWEKENGDISYGTGVDSNTLTVFDLTPFHAGNYRCVVCSGCDNNFSNYATISINGKL